MTESLKTIALADDDPVILRLLLASTARMGYQCVGQAATGLEAVAIAQISKPNVLIIDLHMPGLDGLAAMKQIIPMGNTAVVLITGDIDPMLPRQAMDAGAAGFLVKPFDQNQIRAVLEIAWHRFQA